MANLLSMATIDAILTLRQRNWSIRRIANELGLHRDTVARHLRLHQQAAQATQPVEPATPEADASAFKIGQAPTGAAAAKIGQAPLGSDEVKIGQAPLGSEASSAASESASLCEPYRPIILAKLAA